MRNLLMTALLTAVLLSPGASAASDKAEDEARLAALPMMMPDFRMEDYQGNTHALSDYADNRLVVLFLQINGCPIVRQSLPYFEELRQQYEPTGVAFLMVNCNDFDDNEMVAEEAGEFGVKIPILMDHDQTFANALNVRRSAETLVVNPKTHEILYRGKADDRFDYGLQRAGAKHFWVADILEGKTVDTRKSVTRGCLMDLVDLPEAITFDEDIAPVLAKTFAGCAALDDESTAAAHKKAIWDALLLKQAGLPGCEPRTIEISKRDAHAVMAWLGDYPWPDEGA